MLFYPLLPTDNERSLLAGVRRVEANATTQGAPSLSVAISA
jgi:hypothetical protein